MFLEDMGTDQEPADYYHVARSLARTLRRERRRNRRLYALFKQREHHLRRIQKKNRKLKQAFILLLTDYIIYKHRRTFDALHYRGLLLGIDQIES